MNWKHLIWIIPIILIIGMVIGYKIGLESITILTDMVESMDACCMDSLTYAIDNNLDCKILITGYMQNCTGLG